MSDIQSFRQAVESFIAARGWTPTRFGRTIAGDPLFVFDLREGREPRSDTRTRILKADAGACRRARSRRRCGSASPVSAMSAPRWSASSRRTAQELTRKLGRKIVVTAVCARSRSRDRGIDATDLEWFDDPVALAKSDGIDLFVELIGGEDGPPWQPSRPRSRSAARSSPPTRRCSPATAWRWRKLAEESGAQLGFEAAVAGGIPVIKTLREGLGSARIARVYGIMNGTCNYILSRMGNEGISFADCLKDAQALGYAEADPDLRRRGFRYRPQARHPRHRSASAARSRPTRSSSKASPRSARPISRSPATSATRSSCSALPSAPPTASISASTPRWCQEDLGYCRRRWRAQRGGARNRPCA